MYQHYARPGPTADGDSPGHAVAILSVAGSPHRVRIVDVNTDYQRLWGGTREQWMGAVPVVVEQPAANQHIFTQLYEALKPVSGDSHGAFEGLGGREVRRRHDGTRRHIEWRITAFGESHQGLVMLVLTQRDVTEQVENEARLKQLATTDMLTGLVNRAQFDTVLKSEISRQHRYARPLSLVMLDIDYFKDINDCHGHDVGDQVLVQLASLLKSSLRQADCCARWGGEEFMLLAPETSLYQAVQLADKVRGIIKAAAFPTQGTVTASFGVVEASAEESLQRLMKRVDNALYLAKEQGRDQVSPHLVPSSVKQA